MSTKELIQQQRNYFNLGVTRPLEFRQKQLRTLSTAFKKHKSKLNEALYADMHKSEMEAYVTEIGITIAEIEYNIHNLDSWMKPKKVSTPLAFFPGKSCIRFEPYGVALIIGPWNYPVKNLFGPALGAISAGNCMLLKPSELSANTSSVIREIVTEFFDPSYMAVVEGGPKETSAILEEKFDYIFFTGGTNIGRIIYEAAAKQLTPVTLELGGKSPTIVDKDIDINVTAKRIAWGKFTNAGQTCVAPDYLLVHKAIKIPLLNRIKEVITEFYGSEPSNSPDFGRIISDKHFQRVRKLVEGAIITGGETDEKQRYIAPTVIDNVKTSDSVMQEEIFGPVLPVMEYEKIEDAIAFINKGHKPLALYVFSKNNNIVQKILNETSSGGMCVNETIMHLANVHLPFGGVGNSGFGAYNGKTGFETFSHKRAVLHRSFLFDIKYKYAPFTKGKFNFLRFVLERLM